MRLWDIADGLCTHVLDHGGPVDKLTSECYLAKGKLRLFSASLALPAPPTAPPAAAGPDSDSRTEGHANVGAAAAPQEPRVNARMWEIDLCGRGELCWRGSTDATWESAACTTFASGYEWPDNAVIVPTDAPWRAEHSGMLAGMKVFKSTPEIDGKTMPFWFGPCQCKARHRNSCKCFRGGHFRQTGMCKRFTDPACDLAAPEERATPGGPQQGLQLSAERFEVKQLEKCRKHCVVAWPTARACAEARGVPSPAQLPVATSPKVFLVQQPDGKATVASLRFDKVTKLWSPRAV